VGANQGILYKGGETLEMASKIDSVIFDKTGTLTKGKPAITDFKIMIGDDEFWSSIEDKSDVPVTTVKKCLLWLLGSLERNSEHPLAGAVVAYAEEHLAQEWPFGQPSKFVALTGRGASGSINENIKVAVGNRTFAELQGLKISPQVEDTMQRFERQGKTAIVAAVNSSICVVMGIADELKADAAKSVKYLKQEMGVDVWMVTGDNRRTARAIARQLELPMDRVMAEALPVAKVEKVRKLQDEGRIVAMVGDGVNDSPALAQANVGLSLGTGAEIAVEASDIVLIRGNVVDVCTALHLSRVIFRRIRLNFVWSLLYNCLSIPLAAGVFYPFLHARLPPTAAALAMALSSVSVVLSSLALRLYRAPQVLEEQMLPRLEEHPTDTNVNDLTEPLLLRVREEQDGADDGDLNQLEEGEVYEA
jgi:Cu+-exporting ATPase